MFTFVRSRLGHISAAGRLRRVVIVAGVLMSGAALLAASCAAAQTRPASDNGAGASTGRTSEFDLRRYLRDNPVSPPDTTSPRATLESFLFIMEEARRIWLDVRNEFYEGSDAFLSAAQERRLDRVHALLAKGAQTLDLSDIPSSVRDKVEIERVLQLHEILDRIYLPAFDDIPGGRAGTFLDSHARNALPQSWIVSGTNIVTARQESGARKGYFLVSKETVEHIPEDYEILKSFPAKSDHSEDLFEYYIYTPGDLVAPQWYEFILDGPAWLQKKLAGQTYWQWLALILLTLLALMLVVVYFRWNRWRAVSVSPVRRQLRKVVNPFLLILLAVAYQYLCDDQINISGALMQGISTVMTAVVWIAVAWLTYQAMDLIYTWAMKNPALPTGSLDASLLRTGFRVFAFTVAIVILGYGATQIGIPIYGVIAGLGVGGLAIALAAQPTIENLIGGIILYADRMVRIGEYCQFDDLAGTIESIGIRSTRIRALDRTVITVANADLAKRKIINYSQRDQFQLRHRFGLRYETTPEQLATVLRAVESYLEGHEKVLPEPLRVRFVEMGDYAFTFEVFAYIAVGDIGSFLAVQEEILMKIVGIVHDHGVEFAYPTSTTFVASDKETGVPLDFSKLMARENRGKTQDATAENGAGA